jgi:hypothetical protein
MRRLLMGMLVTVMVIATGSVAHAQHQTLQGPNMFNFQIAPSLGTFDLSGTQFRMEAHYGYDMLQNRSVHHVYIDLPLGLGFGGGGVTGLGFTTVAIIPGVEGDIALPVPVPLYITPFFGMGVGMFFPNQAGADTQVGFAIRLGAGIKYILQGAWSFYFQPFNLEFYPVGVHNQITDSTVTLGFYNLVFGAGAHF